MDPQVLSVAGVASMHDSQRLHMVYSGWLLDPLNLLRGSQAVIHALPQGVKNCQPTYCGCTVVAGEQQDCQPYKSHYLLICS